MSDLTCDLRLGRYQDVLGDVECDALIVDAPYSARTHGGHDRQTRNINDWNATGLNPYARSTHDTHRADGSPAYESSGQPYGNPARWTIQRRAIDYDGWTPDDVAEFGAFWRDRCRGWWVSITDHVLAPVWADVMAQQGLYVFAPLPWFAPGSRVRLAGDGPSSWTCWIIVGRPRTGEDRNGRPYSKWGTLPGGYVVTSGQNGGFSASRSIVVGGKPLSLMEAIISDYSRPGDTVCDPCAGGGTTLLAARKLGRHAIGAEMDPDTHRKASARLGLVDTSHELPLFGGP